MNLIIDVDTEDEELALSILSGIMDFCGETNDEDEPQFKEVKSGFIMKKLNYDIRRNYYNE